MYVYIYEEKREREENPDPIPKIKDLFCSKSNTFIECSNLNFIVNFRFSKSYKVGVASINNIILNIKKITRK